MFSMAERRSKSTEKSQRFYSRSVYVAESEQRKELAGKWRRWALLVIGCGCVVAGLWANFREASGGGSQFAGNSVLRIGIVLVALWLALPTLKKPLQWLPPGILVVCLVGVGALAAQPKLIFVIAPAAGGLLAVAGVVRFLRGR
jgi:hypothetical protein